MREQQGMFDLARLMFIDETSADTGMVRLHGRCARGDRLVGHIPQNHWKTITFVAAVLSENQIRTYWWCSPTKIGMPTMAPDVYAGLLAGVILAEVEVDRIASCTFTSRGRPPRRAGGIIGAINAHSASVRSLG
jgi:hypothetical protein